MYMRNPTLCQQIMPLQSTLELRSHLNWDVEEKTPSIMAVQDDLVFGTLIGADYPDMGAQEAANVSRISQPGLASFSISGSTNTTAHVQRSRLHCD